MSLCCASTRNSLPIICREEPPHSKHLCLNGDRHSQKREIINTTGTGSWPRHWRRNHSCQVLRTLVTTQKSPSPGIKVFCIFKAFHVFKMQNRCFLILLMVLWSRSALSQLYRWAWSTESLNDLSQSRVWITVRTRNRIQQLLGVLAHAETTQPHCTHHKKWKLIFNIPVSKARFWISEKLNIYFIMYDFISL